MHYIKYYLNRSISFARSITTISDSVINIIHLSRKSFLFYKISAWLLCLSYYGVCFLDFKSKSKTLKVVLVYVETMGSLQ